MSGFEWTYPAAVWLLVLVPVAGWLLYLRRRRSAAAARLLGTGAAHPATGAALWHLAALVLLTAAAADLRTSAPREVGQKRPLDLLILLDVSRSMTAEDVAPSRLVRAVHEIEGLLQRRPDDRVALVFYAGTVEVAVPFTRDREHLISTLRTASPDRVAEPGTNLASALAAAYVLAARAEVAESAVLLVTDGENHEPGLDGELRRLRNSSIELIVAGVGTPGGSFIQGPDGGYHLDLSGQPVRTRLEDALLTQLADGPFENLESDGLGGAVMRLASLERSAADVVVVEASSPFYRLFLLAAFVVLAMEFLRDGRLGRLRSAARREVAA
jgi:Ca-activated chloride channel homolog